jgi:hypothetical protein
VPLRSQKSGTHPAEDAYRAWVRRVAPDQLDRISVGLAPLTEVWYEVMGSIADDAVHPEERFPKRPLPTRLVRGRLG